MPDLMESLATPLAAAAAETLEQLAYLFAEPAAADGVATDDVDGIVALAFHGPAHGALILQLSGGILPALASNMLGLDGAPSLPDQRDALGEVANVICGNVLPRIAGATAVFALGVPTPYPSWPVATEALGGVAAEVHLDVEGGRADIALVVHPAA